MSQFLETIQLLDGDFKRLEFHQSRMDKALTHFYPNEIVPLISDELNVIDCPTAGLFKCRVVYDSKIRLVEFLAYSKPIIRTLKVVETDIHSSPFKMADRTDYQNVFSKRDNCDDVLLVKNGLLTDTSYCNIALFDGVQWFTPKTPLIQGINRAQLLADGRLLAKDIKLDELMNFQCISLFNALNEFGTIEIDISNISM